MEKPKEYDIDSFDKLLNIINEENFTSLTSDLILFLHYNVKLIKHLRNTLPKSKTKNKTNCQLISSSFVWIDDGKNEFKFIKIKNSDTGEVTDYELKKGET